jgi:hypothetical protein
MTGTKHLAKIEAALGIASPDHDFRASLLRTCWAFYIESLPAAKIRRSPRLLKERLREAARKSRDLAALSTLLFKSRHVHVTGALHDFAALWAPWHLSKPLHQSGIAWIALLEEFAERVESVAADLTDTGGPRRAVPYDNLILGLAAYYGNSSGNTSPAASGQKFHRFAATVNDLLQSVSDRLAPVDLDLPPSDAALRLRISRLSIRQQEKRT